MGSVCHVPTAPHTPRSRGGCRVTVFNEDFYVMKRGTVIYIYTLVYSNCTDVGERLSRVIQTCWMY